MGVCGPSGTSCTRSHCRVAADRTVRAIEEMGLDGPVDGPADDADNPRGGYAAGIRAGRTPSRSTTLRAAQRRCCSSPGGIPSRPSSGRGTVEAVPARSSSRWLRVMRYIPTWRRPTRWPPAKGASSLSALWLVNDLAADRRHREAQDLFRRLLACRTTSASRGGIRPGASSASWQLPQAFTHLASHLELQGPVRLRPARIRRLIGRVRTRRQRQGRRGSDRSRQHGAARPQSWPAERGSRLDRELTHEGDMVNPMPRESSFAPS